MAAAPATLCPSLWANVLDLLGDAASAAEAMAQLDLVRRLVAGRGVFSIQINATTARDPRNEIRLRRLYSSAADRWPVEGSKRKLRTDWTETLFLHGRTFVAEGPAALQQAFDDHAQLQAHGLRSAINVPLLQGQLCYATFNVFGTRDQWLPHEVLGVRWLALAAARWVHPAPDLAYAFDAPAVAREEVAA